MDDGTRRWAIGPAAWAAPIALLVVLSAVPVVSAAPVPARPENAPLPNASWAFGANRTVTSSGHSANGLSTFTQSATFNWSTVVNQTNTSSTTFEVQVTRTAWGTMTANYCRPDCTDATATANLSVRLWVREVGFANLTSTGTVSAASGPVAAWALEDSAFSIAGNLTQSVRETTSASATTAVPVLHTRTASSNLFVAVTGHASLAFAPALGLFPLDLSAGSWNSTSVYQVTGGWTTNDQYTQTTFAGATKTITGSSPGSVTSRTGIITLQGTTLGGLTLSTGAATTAVQVHVSHPFVLWDGLVVVPAGSDLMQAAAPTAAVGAPTSTTPWNELAAGLESASTSSVDLGARVGHLPILASATAYAPTSSDSNTPAINYTTTDAAPLDGPGTVIVQGEPEQVATAITGSNCAIIACPSNTTSAGAPFKGVLVVGLALIIVVALAVAVVAGRQPPRRTPPSPNARLYPPVSGPGAPARPASPAPPGGSEPDPLDHLW
jgi:hypothetical protein